MLARSENPDDGADARSSNDSAVGRCRIRLARAHAGNRAWRGVLRADPFRALAHERVARARVSTMLLNASGGVAMLLATVGLYPVMATHVHQRGRDIAVRCAPARDSRASAASHPWRGAVARGCRRGYRSRWSRRGDPALQPCYTNESTRFRRPWRGGAAVAGGLGARPYLPARRTARINPLMALRCYE